MLHFILIQCKKCAKVPTSRSADEAEKKGIPSVALQVPFLTTWEYATYYIYHTARGKLMILLHARQTSGLQELTLDELRILAGPWEKMVRYEAYLLLGGTLCPLKTALKREFHCVKVHATTSLQEAWNKKGWLLGLKHRDAYLRL